MALIENMETCFTKLSSFRVVFFKSFSTGACPVREEAGRSKRLNLVGRFGNVAEASYSAIRIPLNGEASAGLLAHVWSLASAPEQVSNMFDP